MKKVLKVVKQNFIGAIIGLALAITISATAVTMFASNDVSYDNSNSGSSATTVKEALDELYGKVPEYYDPYAVGTEVYYNPVSGAKCFDYVSSNSLNENKTGCMKWYIIGSDEDSIDMILDHNTTYKIVWNSSGSNDLGPRELLTELSSDTSGWTGVPARIDSYTDPAYGYTIDYNGDRARLIEANEIARITGADKALQWDSSKELEMMDYPTVGINISIYYLDGKYGTDNTWEDSVWQTQVATSQGASKYAWLYDYTYDCTSNGCNIADSSESDGYWTSSAVSGYSDFAWNVDNNGRVLVTGVHYDSIGVRPVITISKS